MTRRDFGMALLCAALFFVFLFVVPHAFAASTDPDVERLAGETREWAEVVTGVDLQDRPVVLLGPTESFSFRVPRGTAGLVHPDGSTIELDARTSQGVVEFARSGMAADFDFDAMRVFLHEVLHRHLDGGPVEEAATEAMTADLWGAYVYRVTGWRSVGDAPLFYEREVAGVQGASLIATGSRSRQSRAARLWRRAFYAASTADRVAMLQEAAAIRDARPRSLSRRARR